MSSGLIAKQSMLNSTVDCCFCFGGLLGGGWSVVFVVVVVAVCVIGTCALLEPVPELSTAVPILPGGID